MTHARRFEGQSGSLPGAPVASRRGWSGKHANTTRQGHLQSNPVSRVSEGSKKIRHLLKREQQPGAYGARDYLYLRAPDTGARCGDMRGGVSSGGAR